MSTLNIAYDWNNPDIDSSILSNFHPRIFEYDGRIFHSVEQAYQSLKSGEFDQGIYDAYERIFKSKSPIRKIRGKEFKSLPFAIEMMIDLVIKSLEQNPTVWSILGKYDYFTHIVHSHGVKCSVTPIDIAFLNAISYMSSRWKDENDFTSYKPLKPVS